ncbi:MAG: PEGA domain-containing protein [Myxococcales bacterium]|nr:PEGA domain-containing protein [Myxococcales bacterium]
MVGLSIRWSALPLALSLVSPLVLGAPPALAQESATDPKSEARDRFGRGLRLFNDGDNAGALAEFKRANELAPHPVVAFNIGLVYAAMGRAIESVATLDGVIKNPGTLAADKLAKAKATRAEQLLRIAEIELGVNVQVGDVEVDGVRVAKLPLSGPLKVTSGARVVGVVAPGHIPERREVTIAGGAKLKLAFELAPMQGRIAQLAVKTNVPGAGVFVNGRAVGKTPLAATLTLAPGNHIVELRRPGYVTARRGVNLGEGAYGEVSLDLAEDPATRTAEGGRLALDLSEGDASYSIDGVPRGKYTASILLPAGPHLLRVERDGFESVQRTIEVGRAGVTTTVRIALEPTPEYRAKYEKKARLFQTWGWVGVASGVVLAGAGTGFLIWNDGVKDDKLAESTEADRLRQAKEGPFCDPKWTPSPKPEDCDKQVSAAIDEYDAARARDVFGWIGIGAGGAALVAGTVLLLTGDDPNRYERERPEMAKPRVLPALWRREGATTLGVIGAF